MHAWVQIAGYLISFAAAAMLVPVIRRVAIARGWIDRPDGDRKIHRMPIPTVGGLGIAGGFAAGLVFLLLMQPILAFDLYTPPAGFWAGALVILATGLYDDIYGLNFRKKFVIQFIVAYLLLFAGYRINVEELLLIDIDPYHQALYSIPFTLLWIVGIINAVNLIDGLDGLAAGVVMIAFAGLAIMFGLHGEMALITLACLVIPAVAGFLVHNVNPASIFMGDSGSLFLGYMLAAYSLEGAAHTSPWLGFLALVVVLGLPLLDTGLAFTRRWLRGGGIFSADHDHIHHRLVNRWSQQKAVFVLYGVELVFAAAAIGMSVLAPAAALGIFTTVLLATYAGLAALGYVPSVLPRWRHNSRAASSIVTVAGGDGEEGQAEPIHPNETVEESRWWRPAPHRLVIDHLPGQEQQETSETEQAVE